MSKKQDDIKKEWEELKNHPMIVYRCDSCKMKEAIEFNDFKKHLQEEHGIDTTKSLQVRKKLVLHMDGDYWFRRVYDCTILSPVEVKYTESSHIARKTLWLY